MHHSSRLCKLHLGNYTSDFTTGLDGWAAYSVEGDLTLTYNEDAPDGSGGWLKGVYGSTQTDGNGSGIIRADQTMGFTQAIGDAFTFSYSVYLENPGGGNYWGATGSYDDHVNSSLAIREDDGSIIKSMGGHTGQDQVINKAMDNSNFSIINSETYDNVTITWGKNTWIDNDNPNAGAIFYVKDIVIDYWRP